MKRWEDNCGDKSVILKVKPQYPTAYHVFQMMAWLEQERLEGEREVGEGDTYVVYQVRHLPHLW